METAAIVAISAGSASLVTAFITGAFNKWFPSKKEDAERLKILTENEKLSIEAKQFIQNTVDERDRNIQLKIQSFQKELLESADDNYKLKQQMNKVRQKFDDAIIELEGTKKDLAEEKRIRMDCVKRLDEVEKRMSTNEKREDKFSDQRQDLLNKQREEKKDRPDS